MAHQASYRVYRPRRFSEVQGQSRTVDTLREAVRQGRLTHAYVFSGPRGTGKTSVARILAKAVNCENLQDDGDPCLECASCKIMEKGQHLDVIEIDAASNRGIDEIRDIKERITHQTAMSRYKVYIIDEAHMLTPEAFNAFLKTLEEPPPHALFVLATTEAHKLPVTVLSRCQRYEFKRLTVPVIMERLRYVVGQEQVDADPAALELLAEAADGAMRDALSLFDQVTATSGKITVDAVTRAAGMVGPVQMRRLAGAMAQGIEPLLSTLAELRQDGLDEKLILRDLARTFRDVLLFRNAGPDLFPAYRRQDVSEIDQMLPADMASTWWIEAADQLAQAETRLRGGFPADLAVELACLKVQQSLVAGPIRVPQVAVDRPTPEVPVVRTPESSPVSAAPSQVKSGEFQQVLDIVRQERPSTYALFERTSGVLGSDGVLTLYFEFPAHRQLMDQPHNREVVEKAVKIVFGAQAQYRFADGPPTKAEQSSDAKAPLVEQVQEWFGKSVTLVGFDQD